MSSELNFAEIRTLAALLLRALLKGYHMLPILCGQRNADCRSFPEKKRLHVMETRLQKADDLLNWTDDRRMRSTLEYCSCFPRVPIKDSSFAGLQLQIWRYCYMFCVSISPCINYCKRCYVSVTSERIAIADFAFCSLQTRNRWSTELDGVDASNDSLQVQTYFKRVWRNYPKSNDKQCRKSFLKLTFSKCMTCYGFVAHRNIGENWRDVSKKFYECFKTA